MLSKTGFTHSDLLCWQIDYAGGSLNVNGTIMRDTYTSVDTCLHSVVAVWLSTSVSKAISGKTQA
ncbi:hypothetical protein E0U60_22995 [Salmonella enterica subsp. enterica serovar Tees]|nr:hypothetical protein [Salmonella enterica subsp. enterica serovar Tees]ECB6718464.1 hypothetical protein [Salmonella enterica subsp. enterica serovar Tees]OZU34280.1 hypothetical protein CCO32_17550 [Salmonella enterica subsp. enterica serovar Tees]